MPEAPRLKGELVTTEAETERLAAAWRRLAELRGNPFLTPEWSRAFATHYPAESLPAVLAARRPDGEIAGVMPMAASSSGRPRTLRFGGSGLGDHFHPAAAEADEADVAAACGDALGQVEARWGAIVLENVSRDAEWVSRFIGAAPTRLRARSQRPSVLPYADIAGLEWESYLAGRSRSFRNQVGRKLRKLERDHEVAFRRTTERDRVGPDIDELFRLHDLRWAVKDGSSSLADERPRAFHRDFALAAFDHGWLRLYVMEVDGAAAAAWYGWRLGERFSYYQAGLDPAWRDHSAGFLLLAHTFRAAIEEGAGTYEMLLGDEPFKSRFTDAERAVETVSIARRGTPASALIGADAAMRNTGRRLPEPLKRPARALAGALGGLLPAQRRR